jgi:hypothetical protein
VQRHTTSTEFVEWCAFLDLLWEENQKWEYYLAAITVKIEQAFSSEGSSAANLKIEDRLLKFKFDGRREEEDDLSPEEIQEEMELQRAVFEGVMARNKQRHEQEKPRNKKASTK